MTMANCRGITNLTIYFFCLCNVTRMVSASYMALMDAESGGNKHGPHSHTMCISYQPLFSEIPPSKDKARPLPLVDLSNKLGCSSSDYSLPGSNLSGSAIAVSRGDCTFSAKADLAQSAKATSLLIINYKNSSSLPVPIGNGTKDYNEINITVASLTWADYQQVIALPPPIAVKIYAITQSKFDPNMIVILFGSTLIVTVGALWASHSEKHRKCHSEKHRKSKSKNSNDDQSLTITATVVVFWVVFLVGILLLLYFFYDYAVYFFIVTFCIAGSHGLYSCILPLWSKLLPFQHQVPQKLLLLLKIRDKVRVTSVLLLILSFTVGIFWAVQRHTPYAWILQDIMGVTFCISMLQTLRLPSLKIITLIMVLLFFYDIFFVFITPLLTKNGESIMVDVATGGKGHHGEMVPLVFIVPLLGHHPSTLCTGRSFSILGFGDVMLPGLLVAYTAVFGVHVKTRAYLVASSLGYLVGMAGCLTALVFMESGQPALLYLVPATLIVTYCVAFQRGEIQAIWAGKPNSDIGLRDVSAGDGVNCDKDDDDDDEVDEERHFSDEESGPLINEDDP